jgi:hypothetical protein
MMAATQPSFRPIPIYATYLSFERAMDQFQQNGLPPVVATDAITTDSVNTARRLIAGFRALGWIDGTGVPSAELRAMVKARNTAEWQETLRGALRNAYSFLPVEWDGLSAAQLSTAFHKYTGRNDDVLKGAETFFLAAALDAGIPLKPELAIRASKAREDSSTRFRKSAEESVNHTKPKDATARINGAGEFSANADVAQVWNLLTLVDDPEMTEKEKSAALTFFAYLRRRADRKRARA